MRLINPMNSQADELIDAQVFHSTRLQASDEIGRDPVNARGDQLMRLRMRVSQLLKLADEIWRHSMNPEGNQLIEIQVLVALLFQLLHPLRRGPMNSHGDELVRVGLIARLFETANHFRGHAMNLESDELVGVQLLQVFGFDVPGEFQTDIVDGHRPLFIFVNPFETERLHLRQVLRVSYEMKQPRALAVMQKPLAVEFSGVPRDRKMNLLSPGFGKIQSREIACRPV